MFVSITEWNRLYKQSYRLYSFLPYMVRLRSRSFVKDFRRVCNIRTVQLSYLYEWPVTRTPYVHVVPAPLSTLFRYIDNISLMLDPEPIEVIYQQRKRRVSWKAIAGYLELKYGGSTNV